MIYELLFRENNMETIKEGPVEIRFAKSKGKLKVTFIIDFGKTDFSTGKSSSLFNSIVNILRCALNVKLSKCK